MNRRGKKLYHIALLAFSLCSIIPLLIFVYLLVQKGILGYPLAALCIVMGLALAVLGYLFLRSGFEVLSRLAGRLSSGMEAPEAGVELRGELSGKVFEADEILDAFQKTAGRLEESVARIDTLNNRFAFLGNLVHIASCSVEPREMAAQYIEKLMDVTSSGYGAETYLEDGELVKVMAALPGHGLPVNLLRMLDFNTQRVYQTKNPYLGCNFSRKKTPAGRAEEGPLISWPVAHRGEVLGVLHLARGPGSAEFTHEEFRVVRLAADLLGLALDNLRKLRADSIFAEKDQNHESHPEGKSGAPPPGAAVLVVEDEPVVRNMLGKFLASKGWRVYSVSSGREAVSIMEEVRPAVILLGQKLRDMDGMEILRKVKNESPETGVVMTGAGIDPEVFKEARKLGVLDCLVRPIDFNYLENLLLLKMAPKDD